MKMEGYKGKPEFMIIFEKNTTVRFFFRIKFPNKILLQKQNIK